MSKAPNKKLITDVMRVLTRMILKDNGLQLSLDLPGVPQLGAKLEAEGVHVDDADFLAGLLDGVIVEAVASQRLSTKTIFDDNVEVKSQGASYTKGRDVGRAIRKATRK